jgi:hypothetical protein
MRRIGIAAMVAAAGIGGTAIVTTTHAAGLPLPIVGGGSGLPVVGSLPGLGGGSDPISGALGTVGGLPGYMLNCGLMANVPVLQHPAATTKKAKKTKVKHTAPSMPTCGNGLPVVSGLPVVGGIAGGLPTNGLGGLTGGLPVVGDGSGLGGLPIGGLTSGLPIGGLMSGLPIGGLMGGLPIGGLTGGLPGVGGLGLSGLLGG